MQQGTSEWFKARVGKVTSSRIADMVATTKSGWGASRGNYAADLLIERLTGEPAPHYQSPAMLYGTECEPEARAAYCFLMDVDIEEVGFVEHPRLAMCGCSPDGLIGDDGLIEIKCPNTAQHLNTLLTKTIDGKYIKQMQFQMACTGREWCDYVSYDRRLPERMRLWKMRVPRDDKTIAYLEKEAVVFLREIDDALAQLDALYPTAEAA